MVRHFSRSRTGTCPRYAWVPARDVENTVVSSLTNSVDLLANYVADAGRETGPGYTIERILGSITVESQVNGSGGDFIMAIRTQPEGGLTSTPAPDTEVHDWLVWISGRFSSGVNEQAAGVFQPDQLTYQFDVRSRRRLRGMGDEVVATVVNRNATSMLWSINTRILVRVGAV